MSATQNNDLISAALERMANKLEATSKQLLIPPAEWLEKYYWIPEPVDPITGEPQPPGPIVLIDHQRRIINEALSKKPNGMFKYTNIIYSATKKSGKSAITAGVALYMAHTTPFGKIYCLANDGKQSDDRLFGPIAQCIKFHKKNNLILSKAKVTAFEATALLDNEAQIEAIPCDAAGEAGSEPTGVFISEAWAYTTEKKRKLFTELTVSPTKYGRAIRWIESYAGYMGESELLWNLYDLAVLQGTPHPDFLDLTSEGKPVVWVNEAANMFCYWDHEPRLIWQSQEYYCLPLPTKGEELQVLTKRGWKEAAAVSLDDEICTQNQEGIIEYQNPTEIVCNSYSGDLVTLNHSKAHIIMTPNHRVFAAVAKHTRKVKAILEKPFNYEYIQAKDAYKQQVGWIPGHGNWKHSPLKRIKVENEYYDATDFVEFMGWYLSEGNTPTDKRNRKPYVSMVFIARDQNKNPDKCGRIDYLCKKMGLQYTRIHSGFNIYNSRLARYTVKFGKSHDKYIPRYILDECSKEQIEIFLSAYLDGDGSRRAYGNSWMVYTNSDQMSKDLIEAGFKAGFRPKYRGKYKDKNTNSKPIHHIAYLRSHIGWSETRQWGIVKAPSNTIVWCPVLPNKNFYVMQKGTCFWTGNSEESRILVPSEFQRIHRNHWVSSVGAFIQPEWWDACQDETLTPLLDDRTPVVVGIDAAETNDCAAIVAVTRDPNRPETDVAIRGCRIFKPVPGKSVVLLEETLGKTIQEWGAKWNIVCIPYDAFQMAKMVQDYRRGQVTIDPKELEGMSPEEIQEHLKKIQRAIQRWYYKFSQQSVRAVADKQLHDMVVNRQIHWNPNDRDSDISARGDDETLTKHMKQAGVAQDRGQYRIQKLSDKLKTDAAVALSMATERCLALILDNRENDDNTIEELFHKKLISYEEYMRRKIKATLGKG